MATVLPAEKILEYGTAILDGDVSTLLDSTVKAGDVLSFSVPFGALVLDDYSLIERGVAPRDIQYEVFGPDLWVGRLRIGPRLARGSEASCIASRIHSTGEKDCALTGSTQAQHTGCLGTRSRKNCRILRE